MKPELKANLEKKREALLVRLAQLKADAERVAKKTEDAKASLARVDAELKQLAEAEKE